MPICIQHIAYGCLVWAVYVTCISSSNFWPSNSQHSSLTESVYRKQLVYAYSLPMFGWYNSGNFTICVSAHRKRVHTCDDSSTDTVHKKTTHFELRPYMQMPNCDLNSTIWFSMSMCVDEWKKFSIRTEYTRNNRNCTREFHSCLVCRLTSSINVLVFFFVCYCLLSIWLYLE